MTAGALLGAPLGVRISHRIPDNVQFWLFLAYLTVVIIAMAFHG